MTVRVASAVPAALVAEMGIRKLPATRGLPEITPVTGLKLNPGGKVPAPKLVGPLAAEIV